MGVAALSGPVDPARLERGVAALRRLGWRVECAANASSRHGLFAGSDEERLEGLHRLAADDAIAAILFARGGHGALRLLPRIDWDLLGRRPRWFVGYSDLTPLLHGVVSRLGWVALHGPVVAAEPDAEEMASLETAMAGSGPTELELAGTAGDWEEETAPLLGGCLSLLAATEGTAWALDPAGAVLFLEDVDEPLYRFDRMLQQLRLAGRLATVRGVVLGSLGRPGGGEHPPQAVVELVRQAAEWEIPVAWGCPCGHRRPNRTLPLGAPARVVTGSRPILVVERPSVWQGGSPRGGARG